MSRRTEEREIDGAVWNVTQFPASEGLKILTKLFKLLGPVIGAAGEPATASASGAGRGLYEALHSIIGQLDEEEVVALVKRMLKDTRKDGQEVAKLFDVLFMGNYATLFRVLGFVIEINFADFFEALGVRVRWDDQVAARERL